MIRVCCVCRRIETNGTWETRTCLPDHQWITHGYCPECFAEAMAEVEVLVGELTAGGGNGTACGVLDGQGGRCA